nr:MAG TPA: hypothetical protein [Caudoviricetes sp.]
MYKCLYTLTNWYGIFAVPFVQYANLTNSRFVL